MSIGTMDTILYHPREVFRLAIMASAAAIIIAHNLCAATHKWMLHITQSSERSYTAYGVSGDATPSEADIKVTRDLIRAGQLLKIELLDHVIILSKRLDNITYAECWIMPSWRQPSVEIGAKTGRSPDWNLG